MKLRKPLKLACKVETETLRLQCLRGYKKIPETAKTRLNHGDGKSIAGL